MEQGAGLNSGNVGLFSPRSRRSISPCHCFLLAAFFILSTLAAGLGFAQESSPTPPSPLDEAATLLNQGKPREALELLTQISKGPTEPGLEAKLGKAYFQLRQFPQATLHLKNALQQNADDLESTQLLALSFYDAGNCSEALPLLESLGPHLPTNIPDAPY